MFTQIVLNRQEGLLIDEQASFPEVICQICNSAEELKLVEVLSVRIRGELKSIMQTDWYGDLAGQEGQLQREKMLQLEGKNERMLHAVKLLTLTLTLSLTLIGGCSMPSSFLGEKTRLSRLVLRSQ